MPVARQVRRQLTANLREDFAGSKPSRVDREAGIIYGVKVLSVESPNTHGLEKEGYADLEGTRYTLEAMRRAIPLYESNNKVNCNHPDRSTPGKDRNVYDRLGELRNYRVEADGLYADLHLLTAHPLAAIVLEAAEKMPSAFGLSHNARGKGYIDGKWWTVDTITEVRHVDMVADPGSNHSLFESRETAMKLTAKTKKKLARILKPTLEGLEAEQKTKLVDLLEMGDALADMSEDDGAVTGEPPTGDKGYEEHCAEMVKAIILDESLSPEDKIAKIKKALKLLEEEESGKETEESDEDAPGDGRDEEPGKKGKGFGSTNDARESRERKPRKRSSNPEIRELQEQLASVQGELDGERLKNWVGNQLSDRGLTGKVSAELLESIVATGDRQKISKALDQLKGLAGTKKPTPTPRSAAITREMVKNLTESRESESGGGGTDDDVNNTNHVPKEVDQQLAWLFS